MGPSVVCENLVKYLGLPEPYCSFCQVERNTFYKFYVGIKALHSVVGTQEVVASFSFLNWV